MRFHCASLLGAALLLLGEKTPLFAQHKDLSVAFRFGTLGFGLEVNKLLTNHIGARVGANYYKYSATKENSGITYDASLKLQAFSSLVDFFPSNRGSFHLTGGIMTDPAKVSGEGKPTSSGTFEINGTTYTTAQVGTLTGNIKFPGVDPYLGIGWGTPATTGGALKFIFDIGVAIGTAKVELGSTGAASDPQLASDLQAQARTTQDDLDKYAKVYPVLSFGLAYRF